MTKPRKIKLGNFTVDSGQVLIVDPCYLNAWRDGEAADLTSHYGQACELSDSERHGGELTIEGFATGIISTTFLGDGVYPVYAMVDENGLPKKLIIDFDPRP